MPVPGKTREAHLIGGDTPAIEIKQSSGLSTCPPTTIFGLRLVEAPCSITIDGFRKRGSRLPSPGPNAKWVLFLNRQSMKIIIQHAVKQLYLKSSDAWVKDEGDARVFKNSLEAIDFCMAHNVKQVFIVLKFDDPHYDIHLRPFPDKH
jgi:hypothetical protein